MKWTIENLQELVDNHEEETNTLEFKDAGALSNARIKSRDKEELMKDISAMANSNGGTIIFGIQETKEKDHRGKAEKLTPINDPKLSKEWLEQIIYSNIIPKIKDIVITKLTFDDNSWIFVVDIPQSNVCHQAPDKKYYKRYNFMSTAMDDWEIKDILNRQNRPDIEITLAVNPVFDIKGQVPGCNDIVVFLNNKGMVAVNYINCFVQMPPQLQPWILSPRFYYLNNTYQAYFVNKESNVMIPNTGISLPAPYDPLLPGVIKPIGTIRVNTALFTSDALIRCIVATEITSVTKDFPIQSLKIQ